MVRRYWSWKDSRSRDAPAGRESLRREVSEVVSLQSQKRKTSAGEQHARKERRECWASGIISGMCTMVTKSKEGSKKGTETETRAGLLNQRM